MQEKLKGRLTILAVVVAAALIFLVPTFAPEHFKPGGYRWLSRPISLGLDLSGGVHLVYQVETKEAVKSRLQSIGQRMKAELRDAKIATTKITAAGNLLEITLLSARTAEKAKEKIAEITNEVYFKEQVADGERVKLVYEMKPRNASDIERESVNQAVETLRNRVDQFGVSEPVIQRVGESRIMLQMPGVSDIAAVKRIVGSVAKLEFKIVPLSGSGEGTQRLKNRENEPVTVEEQALMTGDSVADARVSMQDTGVEVSLKMTSDGARIFRKITEENVGRQLAIILDNVVYSSPVIREAIGGGMASISGGSINMKEASQLAIVLRAGALPAPLTVMEERTVGPSLGKESIRKGVMAILAGFTMICIFMGVYYGKSGLLANVSLAFNLFLLVACLSAFGATLTLPGLAGLALTAGMAVDSNVIIFERIRDELRIGSGRDAAVALGFEKALSAIVDSNLTTLASGIILYALGSGPVRGFAVTLCVGIATTIFCATFFCRLGFDYFEMKGRKGLSI